MPTKEKPYIGRIGLRKQTDVGGLIVECKEHRLSIAFILRRNETTKLYNLAKTTTILECNSMGKIKRNAAKSHSFQSNHKKPCVFAYF